MKTIRSILLATSLSIMCLGQVMAATVDYTYDDQGRLKTATFVSGEVVQYSYDAAGNRTEKIIQNAAENGPPTPGAVVVLPISGFIVLPLGNSGCSVLAGC